MTLLQNLLRRIQLAWKVLTKPPPQPYVDADGSLTRVLSGISSQARVPGFGCPQCGERIVVDIASLLTKSDLTCSSCALVLKMEWDCDARARAALVELMTAMEGVESARKFRR